MSNNFVLYNTCMSKSGRYQDIADRLKEVRGALNVTQIEFANTIGVSKQTYGHYEGGDTCIPPVRARRLLEIYGVSLDFIYAGSLDTLPHKISKALSSSPSDSP